MHNETRTTTHSFTLPVHLLPTTEKEWEEDKKTLRPEQFHKDEGYIYTRDNYKNTVAVYSRTFGWMFLKLGYTDNINSLVMDSVTPAIKKQTTFYYNPIRFRMSWNDNKHFILEKVAIERLPGWDEVDVALYSFRDQFTRESVIEQRNKKINRDNPTIIMQSKTVQKIEETKNLY